MVTLAIAVMLIVWNLSWHVKQQLAIEEPSTFSKKCKFHQMHEFYISQGTVAIFSGVVDRFRNTYVKFSQDCVYQKLFISAYFDAVIQKYNVYVFETV